MFMMPIIPLENSPFQGRENSPLFLNGKRNNPT